MNDYASLRIEQGTVIHATRDFKAVSFKEILDLHLAGDSDRFAQPDASVGGWSSFVKRLPKNCWRTGNNSFPN